MTWTFEYILAAWVAAAVTAMIGCNLPRKWRLTRNVFVAAWWILTIPVWVPFAVFAWIVDSAQGWS